MYQERDEIFIFIRACIDRFKECVNIQRLLNKG